MSLVAVATVARRELWALLCSPLGWVIWTLFLLVQGYCVYALLQLLSHPQAPHGALLQFFFGGTSYFWLSLLFVVATVTMRTVAEERRSGMLEALLTAPLRAGELVGGKFIAAWTFYALLWAPTTLYGLLVSLLAETELSIGPLASGYLGTILVGGGCLSVGVLASALARSQMVAALLTFAALSLLLLLAPLELYAENTLITSIARHANLFDQMGDFARGIVDSRHVVFHASLMIFCLVAATKAVERRR